MHLSRDELMLVDVADKIYLIACCSALVIRAAGLGCDELLFSTVGVAMTGRPMCFKSTAL